MKVNWLFGIVCINIFVFSTAVRKDFELQFVQILFRHGDRAPIQLYPNDPNPESFWQEGLGELTMIGRRQHYGLGKFFRSYYKNFTTSSPLEVNVISSDCDRCLKSVETNLAAFYAPDKAWKFEKRLNWQPIAIHSIPKDEDKYLETDSYCPRAEAEKQKIVDSPAGQKFIAKHKEMFDNLTVFSGTTITNWTSAAYLHDVLLIEKKYNLTIPSWVDPYWDELSHVADLSFFWSFNSPTMHRLRAGPFIQRVIEKMNEKINGEIPRLKFQIYSAHDTNIAVVLDALNLFNMKQPPYCSSLLFELYNGPDDEKFIRLLFLNSTDPEKAFQTPHILILDGCTEYCSLDYFLNYTQHLLPINWDRECQLSKSFVEKITDEEVEIGVIFIIVVFIMITTSFIAVWKMYSRRRNKYAYHLMPME